MKLDVLRSYKDKINTLKEYESRFRFVEAHSAVAGVANIGQLMTLSETLIGHVKDAMSLVKEPFESAVIDNLISSGEDVATTLQLIEYTPSDLDFDARDILDLKQLNVLSENIFRCIVAIKSCQGLSMPRALVTLDLIVHDVLYAAYELFTDTVDPDFMSMSGKTSSGPEPIIRFTMLNEQKYFNDEEKQAIADREASKQRAIVEARDRAALEDKAFKCKTVLMKFSGGLDTFSSSLTPEDMIHVAEGYKFWTAGSYGSDLVSEKVSDGVIRICDLARFARFIGLVRNDNAEYMFKITSTYEILDDLNDVNPVRKGEIITLIKD